MKSVLSEARLFSCDDEHSQSLEPASRTMNFVWHFSLQVRFP